MTDKVGEGCMPMDEFLEVKKELKQQEFKTEQMQETLQETIQQPTYQEVDAYRQPEQKKDGKRVENMKRQGIVEKTMNFFEKDKGEIYGAKESDRKGNYAQERKNAFQEHLLEMTQDHLMLNYGPEYTEIMKEIRQYAILPATRDNSVKKGEKLTSARVKIRAYIEKYSGKTELSPETVKALEIMNMYKLYFETFTDGNLMVPTGAYEKKYVGKNDPGMLDEINENRVKYQDASDYVLFPHEPCMEDIKQGMIGDCYLLAGLASLVMTDPMQIKRSMRDNGKTVTVRFYEPIFDDDKQEVGLRPVYITVNKSIVKFKYISFDMYAEGSLWVQMLEKAYAAWGFHRKSVSREQKRKQIEEQVEERMSKEQVPLSVYKDRLKEEVEEQLNKQAGSYQQIVGGQSEIFLRYFTGKEIETSSYSQWHETSKVRKTLENRLAKPLEGDLKLLLGSTSEEEKEVQEVIKRVTLNDGVVLAEQLMNLKKVHGKESADVLQACLDVLSSFYIMILDSYYGVDTEEKSQKHTSVLYIEDLQAMLKDSLNKKLFTSDGKIGYNIGEDFKPVMEALVSHLLKRLEEALEQEQEEQQEQDDVAVLKFVHHRTTGRYTSFAEKEYQRIKDSLKSGYLVSVGTMKTSNKKGSGLNGEVMKEGIAETHGYSVIGTREMEDKKFVLVRNPWASGIQKYVRTVEKGQESFRAKYSQSSSSNGIFYIELNEFLTRIKGIRINKEKGKELVEEESALRLDGLDREEKQLAETDQIYAEVREWRIRRGFVVKAEQEAENPELKQYHIPVEAYASPQYLMEISPITNFFEDMTEENPHYKENKAKIDTLFPRYVADCVKHATLTTRQEVLAVAENRVLSELNKRMAQKEDSAENVQEIEKLTKLHQLYQKKRLQVETERMQTSPDDISEAMAHLINGYKLNRERTDELKAKGLI